MSVGRPLVRTARPRAAALLAAILAATPATLSAALSATVSAVTVAAAVVGATALSVPAAAQAVPFTETERARILQLSPLPPPPPDPTNAWGDDPGAARLGQRLFHDARLSADGSVSCATCHPAEGHFADGRQLARGLQQMTRHAPALWNVAYNRWFFWDGRADSLWSQALSPLEDPREHGTTRRAVVALLREDPDLRAEYERVFGPLPDVAGPAGAAGESGAAEATVTSGASGASGASDGDGAAPADVPEAVTRVFVNAGKAIAAYERRLLSRRAPFDVFVEGLREDDPEKLAALSASAQRGLRLFVGRASCRLCHSGPELTDKEFHSTRVVPLREDLRKDPGRLEGIALVLDSPFNGRSPWSDDPQAGAEKLAYLRAVPDNIGQFKTPTLRNVALTAPYMHQGQTATLRDALRHYSTFERTYDPNPGHFERMLVPLHLSEQELDDLLAFLESLTDVAIDPALLGPPPPRHGAPR
jgi:cytochrome c peroxidase